MERLVSLIGLVVLMLIAWVLSENRRKVAWKTILWGVALQLFFAVIVLATKPGREFFEWTNDIIKRLLSFTDEGSKFLFGSLITRTDTFGFIFAFKVLPTIIFFSSFMAVMYHLGVMQTVILFMARIMSKTMGTSGAESLSAAANIFVGQTEAPLVVRPYVPIMTRSELMAVMTGGMATVAGGVMAAYVGMLSGYFPDIAGHLLAASIMSAPAALVIAKIMVPETEEPLTKGEVKFEVEKIDANVIDAAARGAGEGMKLALNVGAMLLAFIALVAMINTLLISIGDFIDRAIGKDPNFVYTTAKLEPGTQIEILDTRKMRTYKAKVVAIKEKGLEITAKVYGSNKLEIKDVKTGKVYEATGSGAFEMSMQNILGILMAPLAWIMGVPWKDAKLIGALIGEKTVLNEFVAYAHLGEYLKMGVKLDKRSIIIATYALCGFANFGSIAIQLGGIGGMAPERRKDLAELGLKAMIAGSLAAFMTATIAGILVP